MKNISLLPAELKSYKESAGRISKIVVRVIILILAFVLVYVSLSFAFLAPGREIAQARLKRAEIGQKLAKLQQYGNMAARTSILEEKVKQALEDRPRPDELLSQIFASFPGKARLTELSIAYISENKDSKINEIKMQGLADSHIYVADLLAGLKALDSLEGVKCKSSVAGDGGSAVLFEINAGIAGANGKKASAGEISDKTHAGGGRER